MGAGAYITNNRVNAAVAARADARQPVEDVVSLASPFDEQSDAFASTVAPSVINNATPLSPVETTPVQKSLIPKDFAYDPDYQNLPTWVDSRIPSMIWDASRKMNVPNPAYVAPDYSGLEFLNSLGADSDGTSRSLIPKPSEMVDNRGIPPMIWDASSKQNVPNPAYTQIAAPDFGNMSLETLSNLSYAHQQQEAETYGLMEPLPQGFSTMSSAGNAAQKIYFDEANKMIKDFGVAKEDAEQWYSDILEFTEDRPVYGLDINPELSDLAEQRTQMKDEGYVNKTNAWVSELDGLKGQDPSSFTSAFDEMPYRNKLQYLYSSYEKGELSKDEYKENFKNIVNARYDPELNPQTKIIIDIKGNDYLVDAQNVYGQMTDPFFLKHNAFYADDSLYFPSEDMSEGAWLQAIGVGQKSAENKIENLLEPSTASFFLNNPVTQLAGLVIPGFSAATTLAKVGTGEKVSPMEIAGGLLTGLEMAGVVKPPSLTAMPAGQMGTPLPNAGTGLFGSTYAQTQTALNVAAAGDAEGAAIALVGDNLIKGGLDGIGLDQAAIEGAGIQYDDFQAGIGKTVQKLAEGEELDDALAHGLGKYIREGGTLGSIDLPSVDLGIDLGGVEDLAKDLVRPIGAIATNLAHLVEDGAQAIGDATRPIIKAIEEPLKPVGDVIEDVAQASGDVIEDVGQAVGDVVEDVAKPVGDVIEDVAQVAGDVVEDVGQAVGDVASDLDTAVRQALPNTSIDLPSVDLSSVDLPSVGLPNLSLNLPQASQGMMQINLSTPAPTRTTDALFKDELFKFQTEIGVEIAPLEYVDLNTEPENFFKDTFYEDPILGRSYNF